MNGNGNGNGTAAPRNPNGTFVSGVSGNPNGRPKGTVSGRHKVVQLIDRLAGSEAAQTVFEDHLHKMIAADPEAFLQKYVLPLLPKEMVQVVSSGRDRAPVRILGMEGPSDGTDSLHDATLDMAEQEDSPS